MSAVDWFGLVVLGFGGLAFLLAASLYASTLAAPGVWLRWIERRSSSDRAER